LENNTLEEVFVKMARWYDIEYSFKDKSLAGLTLSGTLPHSESIDDILKVISSVTEVNIEIRGRKVTIDR
jgi:ferric-dicitrate binding protein FerR (iron transport regulator)